MNEVMSLQPACGFCFLTNCQKGVIKLLLNSLLGKYKNNYYFGEVLVNSFFFTINSKGLNLLLTKIKETASNISVQKVLISIETTEHYHEIIVRYRRYEVQKRNAIKSKIRVLMDKIWPTFQQGKGKIINRTSKVVFLC